MLLIVVKCLLDVIVLQQSFYSYRSTAIVLQQSFYSNRSTAIVLQLSFYSYRSTAIVLQLSFYSYQCSILFVMSIKQSRDQRSIPIGLRFIGRATKHQRLNKK